MWMKKEIKRKREAPIGNYTIREKKEKTDR